MAHVIVKEKLYNQAFVGERTEGFDEFAASLEKFTPEYAESISGVDRELIAQAARLYAQAERGAIYWGMGISQLAHGTASGLALVHLALLTGHIGREGTGLNPLRGQNNVQGASDCGRHALSPARLHAGGRAGQRRAVGEGLEYRAGRPQPPARPDHHRDPVARPPGRGARAVYHGREPHDERAQPERHPRAHAAAGVRGGPGPVHQRVRRLCRCVPAGGLVGRERRHLHQHRPARAARAPGHRPARRLAARLADHLRPGQPPRAAPGPAQQRLLGL